jgi:Spy/CpxP family protein refolding chaperone
MNTIKIIAACAVFTWVNYSYSQHTGHQKDSAAEPAATTVNASPYAGEQARDIKSLSAADVASLRNGAGMAYAKAAELNGYPGPSHVLELAVPLQLTSDQRNATEKLMAEHKSKARDIGEQLIAAERALDTAFALKKIDRQRITELTQRIGALQATLRAEHLQTHLQQTSLLNVQQVTSYQTLRGYDKPNAAGSHQHAH